MHVFAIATKVVVVVDTVMLIQVNLITGLHAIPTYDTSA